VIAVSQEQIVALVGTWLWPLIRIAAVIGSMPSIGTRSVPARIRLILALCITAVVVPLLPPPPAVDLMSAEAVLITVQQVLIGVIMGFSLRLIFAAIDFAGTFLGQQMGLGMAAMIDPQNGTQSPVIGQFYVMLATLLFFSLDGHLLCLQALAGSFHTIPVGVEGISRAGLEMIVKWSGDLFLYAALIALPTTTALLIVNLGYGILARTAPQLHIFAVGFPITIIAGILLTSLSLSHLPENVSRLMEVVFELVGQMLSVR
jgi:flagellar biosynthetic protein FliR